MRLLPILIVATAAAVVALLFLRPGEPAAPAIAKSTDAPATLRAVDAPAPPRITMNSPGTLPYKPVYPPPPLDGPLDRTFTAEPTSDPRLSRTPDDKIVINSTVALGRKLREPTLEAGAQLDAAEDDLYILEGILAAFRRYNIENPVGDNDEVMRSLMGENNRNIVFFPADHPAINELGQLLDPWGRPYYFHAISSDTTDIWSSGPDREFGTNDDLKLYGDSLKSETGDSNPGGSE